MKKSQLHNIFILSPGRTATTTFAHIGKLLNGYTSGHETRTKHLGLARLDYPAFHIECDNRLCWFLGRLDARYGDDALYVVIERDRKAIAKSYNTRWRRLGLAKAYSQGILQRDYSENSLAVCEDLVSTVYENIYFFLKHKTNWITIKLEEPETGLLEFCEKLGQPEKYEEILQFVKQTQKNKQRKWIHKLPGDFLAAVKFVLHDVKIVINGSPKK